MNGLEDEIPFRNSTYFYRPMFVSFREGQNPLLGGSSHLVSG